MGKFNNYGGRIGKQNGDAGSFNNFGCIIGEHKDFIHFHNKAVSDYLHVSPLLPVPYEFGFGRTPSIKE